MAGSRRGRAQLGRRALAALLGLLAGACAGSGVGASSPVVSHALVGAPAPGFELPQPSGGDQSLADHAGKVVIVDFWATWCQPCKQSFPVYQKLVQSMNGELVVIAISQDDDTRDIAGFVADTGATFPVVWDEGKSVAKSYDPPTMPTAYVIDRSGIVRFVHAGYRSGDEAKLEEEVRSLAK